MANELIKGGHLRLTVTRGTRRHLNNLVDLAQGAEGTHSGATTVIAHLWLLMRFLLRFQAAATEFRQDATVSSLPAITSVGLDMPTCRVQCDRFTCNP